MDVAGICKEQSWHLAVESKRTSLRLFGPASRPRSLESWTDIAKYPSHHMTKKSRPDSDYKLEEPSHMKSDGLRLKHCNWRKMPAQLKTRYYVDEFTGVRRIATGALNHVTSRVASLLLLRPPLRPLRPSPSKIWVRTLRFTCFA